MNFLDSLANQLDKHQLFRRLILFFACWLVAYTTAESFYLAAVNVSYTGIEVAAIITAIQLPVTAMTSFVSKLYWEGK